MRPKLRHAGDTTHFVDYKENNTIFNISSKENYALEFADF
jgi:hypothetical protein